MPFSGNTFTNVSGATTAVAGDVIQSATWDNVHTDYATAFTQLMSQMTSMETCRNALYMNGGFEVWQRGAGSSASIAVAATTLAYTADRWYLQTGANQASVVSAQAPLTGNYKGSNLSGRVIRNNGQSGVTAYVFAYPLDTDEIARLLGNKVSFTATVQAGANWSPASGTLTVNLFVGTGAVGKRNATPYTNETTALTIATNLTAGGSVTTITGASSAVIPTTTTQAELQFTWTPVGTAGAADSITIDNVQLEPQVSDSTWTITDFDFIPFFDMLSACQRHYAKTWAYGTAPLATTIAGALATSSQAVAKVSIYWQFPARMRVTPSITATQPLSGNANQFLNNTSSSALTATVDPGSAVADAGVHIVCATVTAQDNNLYIHVQASAGI
jgi:hypothetical protein